MSSKYASMNKWSVPIVSTRPGAPVSGDDSGGCTSNDENEKKIHEPCVKFISGSSVSSARKTGSRSNSLSSSGAETPLRMSGAETPLRMSGRTSPDRDRKQSQQAMYDPCVMFTQGKSVIGAASSPPKETHSTGVSPHRLDNALKKATGRRGHSVGTRLAPKQIVIDGITKSGAVSNKAGIFESGGVNNNNNTDPKTPAALRKQSATCVLRDDFHPPRMSSTYKSKLRDTNESDESSASVTTTTGKHKTSVEQDVPTTKRSEKKVSPSQEKFATTRKFSSSTSQACLVMSQVVSPEDNVFSVVNSTSWKEDNNNGPTSNKHLTSPPTYRKRNLLNSERKSSLGSSVENSDDEGSHVDSSEENELNNWKDRRRSYLCAKSSNNLNTLDTAGRIDEADDEDSDVNISSPKSYSKNEEQSTTKVIKEGPLNRKHERANDRRRPISRTWKPIYAVLKGHRLFCYKKEDGVVGGGDDEIIQPIPVRSSIIEIASNYVKRKNVFRMVTSHDNEYLFQAENSTSMREWVAALREANPDKESLNRTTVSVVQDQGSPPSKEKEQKHGGLTLKKSAFRFGASKKGSRGVGAPGGYTPPITVQLSPEQLNTRGRTFGTHLNLVPMCDVAGFEKVPTILYNCCSIIEDKGINQTGLYRVPGNNATSNILREELDTKEPEDVDWSDEKWQDLNNICTLVKLFLRELTDPLIPNTMYSKFIQANRIKDSNERLKTLKQLTWELPEYHFDSLRFLVNHMKIIADNSINNLMTEKNIAVILAPNIVHTSEVGSLLQDMSDQIQIVELMIRQCDWMFNDSEDCASIPEESETTSESIIAHSMTQNLMLTLKQQEAHESDGDSAAKKGSNLSHLKSKFSMRLKSKNISPKQPKRDKPSMENESDDDDTSESIPTSPTLEAKHDRTKGSGANFLIKSTKEIAQNTVPGRRASHSGVTTKQQQQQSDIQIQIKHRSPDLSPKMSRSDIMRASTTKKETLSEDTIKRLNQLTVSRSEDTPPSRNMTGMVKSDEGWDSGIVDPHSDDMLSGGNSESIHATYQKDRKGSLDSLSGSTLPTLSRFNLRHPTPTNGEEQRVRVQIGEKVGSLQIASDNIPNEPYVVNRRTTAVNRRKQAPSPGISKRGIRTIMPDDSSGFEEKLSALIDPEYTGELKEIARSEMNQSKANRVQQHHMDSSETPSSTRSGVEDGLSGSSKVGKVVVNFNPNHNEKVHLTVNVNPSNNLKKVNVSPSTNEVSLNVRNMNLTNNVTIPAEVSLNVQQQPTGQSNAEWWLAPDNRSTISAAPRRVPLTRPPPRDKSSALNIISNAINKQTAIENRKRETCYRTTSGGDSTSELSDSDGRTDNRSGFGSGSRKDTRADNRGSSSDGGRSDSHSDILTRRLGTPTKLPYKVELLHKVDKYNTQMEECNRKFTTLLGSNNTHNYDPPYPTNEMQGERTKSEQIQYYLDQVSKLLEDSSSTF